MDRFVNYELMEERMIEDVHAKGYVLRHVKSGARVVVLSNDDDNKVFSIGFRTTPMEDTGVPHILEHSVLCGSKLFPVKDPFIELAKGSLNTFLNAMTYPDKTLYPIASYNDKDFRNLMHIYMDAVFYPNITLHDKSFRQEGWHYELESLDAPLEINGVVYNEMKGAYSSGDEILQAKITQTLFPDNTYGHDSGGDPWTIPELTYEHYLDFYHTYYHPSNCYIYLYGDMDVEERLAWMDREYLSHFDTLDVDSHVQPQTPFARMKDVSVEIPITEEEKENRSAILSYNKVVEDILDSRLYYAFDTLSYVLANAPGAPVKQALLDAGIGQDVYCSYYGEMLQPYMQFVAKNADTEDKTRFVEVIEATLKKVAEEGIDKEALLGSINMAEFKFREADYGQFPKGLMYGLLSYESWIYDETRPFLHLECLDTFRFLRQMVETDYFEQLIRKYLIDNPHGAVVTAVPKKGLADRNEKKLEAELRKKKESFSQKELEQIIADTKELSEYQETEDTKEALASIPVLHRSDLRKEALPFRNEVMETDHIQTILHDYETNGIDYVTFLFDVNDTNKEELPYLGLLQNILGYVDTENYSYREFANKSNMITGGIESVYAIYPILDEKNKVDVRFEVRLRALSDKLKPSLQLVQEMMFTSKMTDTKRLKEIISQTKSRMQERLSAAGHLTASTRALSGISSAASYQDMTSGVGYYKAVCAMEQLLESNAGEAVSKLEALIQRIFVKERMRVSYTNTGESFEKDLPALKEFLALIPKGEGSVGEVQPKLTKKKEGFIDASQIQYVAKGGNFVQKGYSYSGYLAVLMTILEYDYLWTNVRVMGGAYGCMNTFRRNGDTYFTSYRDPNLAETIEVYDKIPEYLRNFQATEEEMTKYIVGTFGAMDIPLTASQKGFRSMSAFLQHLTYEEVQKERDEILGTSREDIAAQADLVASVLEEDVLCVVGNENAIKDNSSLFEVVSGLTE